MNAQYEMTRPLKMRLNAVAEKQLELTLRIVKLQVRCTEVISHLQH
jgi:hypothetical protein